MPIHPITAAARWKLPHERQTTGEQSRPLITIIEDDGAVRFAISSVMRSAGFRTATFDSAEAFLDAGLLHEKACLILDVQMAGRSGLELQRHLLTEGTAPPIIFVSARATGHDVALRNGAVAFLQKPFSAEELLRAVRQALE